MSVSNFKDLKYHVGHRVSIVAYKDDDGKVVNVAIECLKCNEVLLDFDKED